MIDDHGQSVVKTLPGLNTIRAARWKGEALLHRDNVLLASSLGRNHAKASLCVFCSINFRSLSFFLTSLVLPVSLCSQQIGCVVLPFLFVDGQQDFSDLGSLREL